MLTNIQYVYAIFNRDFVLSFLEIENESNHGAYTLFYNEVQTSSYVMENKKKVIKYIEIYINDPNKEFIIQELNKSVKYSFRMTKTFYYESATIEILVNEHVITTLLSYLFLDENLDETPHYFNPERIIYDIENDRMDNFTILNYDIAKVPIQVSKNFISIGEPFFELSISITQFNKYFLIQSLEELLKDMILKTQMLVKIINTFESFEYVRGKRLGLNEVQPTATLNFENPPHFQINNNEDFSEDEDDFSEDD